MQTSRVTEWVHLCERWCEPDWIHWCDGSPRDLTRLVKLMGHSDFSSFSAVTAEGQCVTPEEAMTRIAVDCRSRLRGRIMFVVPYLLPGDDAGVLVTDSATLAAQFCRMASVGAEALTSLAGGREFAAHLHLSANETSENGSSDSELSLRCHLSGPAVIETACRTGGLRRRSLPMETKPVAPAGEASCVSCLRLCPNRASAVAAAARRSA
jgi:GTP-dependent phosphoenolpyruvate carboxykinase